jgi:hypothetical protein
MTTSSRDVATVAEGRGGRDRDDGTNGRRGRWSYRRDEGVAAC